MMVTSGIDIRNYERALEIIERQVEDMREGKFDERDLLFTKKSLVNHYRTVLDSPATLVDRAMYGLISGRTFELDQRLAAIEGATRQQVIDVAQRVAQDTIY